MTDDERIDGEMDDLLTSFAHYFAQMQTAIEMSDAKTALAKVTYLEAMCIVLADQLRKGDLQ